MAQSGRLEGAMRILCHESRLLITPRISFATVVIRHATEVISAISATSATSTILVSNIGLFAEHT